MRMILFALIMKISKNLRICMENKKGKTDKNMSIQNKDPNFKEKQIKKLDKIIFNSIVNYIGRFS